ncbi:MAG: DUF805 domain-containing protein [Desulfobacterales bacterium]|nr:DUF805 domain-containing protein [Desulfobacterales bacterium]
MNYFTDALKKYADFNGRATRTQFWMFVLFYFIFCIIAAVIDSIIGASIFSIILMLGLIVPSISITARRLHDISKSGWWQLVALVPVIGSIVLIIFCVMDSHPQNQYGPNPK